jgi:hypothetical protein
MRTLGKVVVIPTVASGLIAGGVGAYAAFAGGGTHDQAGGKVGTKLAANSAGNSSNNSNAGAPQAATPTVTPKVPCSTIHNIPQNANIDAAPGGTVIGQATAGDPATCHSFKEVGTGPSVWYNITDSANGVTGWVPGTPWGEN